MKHIRNLIVLLLTFPFLHTLPAQTTSFSGIWINKSAQSGEVSTLVIDLPNQYAHVFLKADAMYDDEVGQKDLGVIRLQRQTRVRYDEYLVTTESHKIKIRKGNAGRLSVFTEDLNKPKSLFGSKPALLMRLTEETSGGLVKFFNDTNKRADIYYDTGSKILLMQQLNPSRSFEQATYPNMTWVALDRDRNLLKKVTDITRYEHVYIDGTPKDAPKTEKGFLSGIYINPKAKRGDLARVIVDGHQAMAEGFLRKDTYKQDVEVSPAGISSLASADRNLIARFSQHQVVLKNNGASHTFEAEVSTFNSRGYPQDKTSINFEKLTFENADGVIEFFNQLNVPVDIYCQTEKNMLFLMTLEAGDSYRQPTLLDLKWVAKHGSQRLREIASQKGVQQVIIGENEQLAQASPNPGPSPNVSGANPGAIPDYPRQQQPGNGTQNAPYSGDVINPNVMDGSVADDLPPINPNANPNPAYNGNINGQPLPSPNNGPGLVPVNPNQPAPQTPTYPQVPTFPQTTPPNYSGTPNPQGQAPMYNPQSSTPLGGDQLDMSYLPRPLNPLKILFGNGGDQGLTLYVIGSNGRRYEFGKLNAGSVARFDAFFGQKWVAYTDDGNYLGSYEVATKRNHRHIFHQQ